MSHEVLHILTAKMAITLLSQVERLDWMLPSSVDVMKLLQCHHEGHLIMTLMLLRGGNTLHFPKCLHYQKLHYPLASISNLGYRLKCGIRTTATHNTTIHSHTVKLFAASRRTVYAYVGSLTRWYHAFTHTYVHTYIRTQKYLFLSNGVGTTHHQ